MATILRTIHFDTAFPSILLRRALVPPMLQHKQIHLSRQPQFRRSLPASDTFGSTSGTKSSAAKLPLKKLYKSSDANGKPVFQLGLPGWYYEDGSPMTGQTVGASLPFQ